MKRFTPITELTEGQEFTGYQQYFQVLSITDSIYHPTGKCVSIFVFAGECHRVEQGDYNDILKRLNAALDTTSNHDEYWEQEHPEIMVTAIWPDDGEFDKYEDLAYTSTGPIDCITGEKYNWLP